MNDLNKLCDDMNKVVCVYGGEVVIYGPPTATTTKISGYLLLYVFVSLSCLVIQTN